MTAVTVITGFVVMAVGFFDNIGVTEEVWSLGLVERVAMLMPLLIHVAMLLLGVCLGLWLRGWFWLRRMVVVCLVCYLFGWLAVVGYGDFLAFRVDSFATDAGFMISDEVMRSNPEVGFYFGLLVRDTWRTFYPVIGGFLAILVAMFVELMLLSVRLIRWAFG